MKSEVTDLIAALREGSMSLEQVASRFRERSWPHRPKPTPATYLEMADAAQEDPEPYLAGSFDDVIAAYDRGELTRSQYRVLAEAVAESSWAEDSHIANEQDDQA
jgi:hypothetical protein